MVAMKKKMKAQRNRDFCRDKLIKEIEIRYDDNIDKIMKNIILECKGENNG